MRLMNTADLMTAYECGIDYGLLLAESERDGEDLFDAAGCAVYAAKMCIPSASTRRRMPWSEAWRAAKRESMDKFLALIVRTANEEAEAAKEGNDEQN